ncbi:hypothetical protein QCA50_005494 [Cerrena zonata]|uniref:Uncharacterized protein n=1 Tax=Cerrena zonata TaxID=2478898 RepID=A0AAW0GPC8_9APHY
MTAISDEKNSLGHIAKLVSAGSQVAHFLSVRDGETGAVQGVKYQVDTVFPDGVELFYLMSRFSSTIHRQNDKFKREIQPKILPKVLADGLIKPNRVREVIRLIITYGTWTTVTAMSSRT